MIVTCISHRNRQKRRALAAQMRATGLMLAAATPSQIREHCLTLTNYLRDARPDARASLGLEDDPAHGVLTYIVDHLRVDADDADAGEKVDLVGYRNSTPQFERAQTEMLALVGKARGADPIEHYVISWGEDERPSPDQIEDAVEILMRALNLQDHQAIYAAHRNTANYHVHVAANRVHPETHQLTQAGDGWQVKAALQAAALIEHRQGWASQEGALYEAGADGARHRASGILVRKADGTATDQYAPDRRLPGGPIEERLSAGARGYEHRTGRESFERIAITVAAPIITRAGSWDDLHQQLAEQGLGYVRYGTNGARITMGERAISASIGARDAALSSLTDPDALGPFVAGDPSRIVSRRPRYLPGQERRSAYEAARTAHAAHAAAAQAELDAVRSHARATISAWRQAFFAQVNAIDWRGRRDELNATRKLFGQHFQEIELSLASATTSPLQGLKAAARFPSYEAWCAGAAVPSIPNAMTAGIPVLIAPSGDMGVPGTPVSGYTQRWEDRACVYLDSDLQAAFVDRGSTVEIHTMDRASVTAALKLAQEKWGKVELISGSDAFLRLATEIARAEKIVLTGKLAERYRRAGAGQAMRTPVVPPPLPSHARPAGIAPTSISSTDDDLPFSPVAETEQRPVPSPGKADGEVRGHNAHVDAWLDVWRREPDALPTLRSLAHKAVGDPKARALLEQWTAEGFEAARRIRQHATDHTRMLKTMQDRSRKLAPKLRR